MVNQKAIICIDDEDQILRALKRCLRGSDYEVYTTVDPDQVVAWIAEGKAQVVISDYRMQKMTGLDLLKKVQEINPAVIRVILSGYAEQEAVNAAIRSGLVLHYMLKPWEAEQLKGHIADYFKLYESG